MELNGITSIKSTACECVILLLISTYVHACEKKNNATDKKTFWEIPTMKRVFHMLGLLHWENHVFLFSAKMLEWLNQQPYFVGTQGVMAATLGFLNTSSKKGKNMQDALSAK